jgi:hypothetical protein
MIAGRRISKNPLPKTQLGANTHKLASAAHKMPRNLNFQAESSRSAVIGRGRLKLWPSPINSNTNAASPGRVCQREKLNPEKDAKSNKVGYAP